MGKSMTGIGKGLAVFVGALALLFSACQIGAPEELPPTLVKNIEVKGDQVNVYANRPLEPGAYIVPSPPRLVLQVKNSELDTGAPKSGEGSGGLIKSWSVEQLSLKQEVEGEEKETKVVKLTIDLVKNITYRVTGENFGFSVALEEVKKSEEPAKATNIEIPKELYSQVQKLGVTPGGQPTGQAVVPYTPEDASAAKEMLKEIIPEKPAVVRLPPATAIENLTYKSTDGTFEAIITGDGEFNNYKLLSLDMPLRVALDFYGVQTKLDKKVFYVNSGRVKQIRIGQYPDRTRLVIELNGKTLKDARVVSVEKKMMIKIIY